VIALAITYILVFLNVLIKQLVLLAIAPRARIVRILIFHIALWDLQENPIVQNAFMIFIALKMLPFAM